jgi:cytochrome c oxidase subunit I
VALKSLPVLSRERRTRVALLIFIILAVGFHHQFTDPGISMGLKYAATVLTFGIFFPSLMTAFAVMYALEIAGRRRGAKGLVHWFFRINWGDPSVSAQVLACLRSFSAESRAS